MVTSAGVGLGGVTAGLATAGTTAGVVGAVGGVGDTAGAEGVENWTLRGNVPIDVVAVIAWLHSMGFFRTIWRGSMTGKMCQRALPAISAQRMDQEMPVVWML